jgi:spore germination protein GerM
MKRKKRKKGKSGVKGVLITLVLIGIAITVLSLFHQEIFRFVRPWIEKRGFIEGKREATLYFSDQDAEFLIGEKREIRKRDEVEEEVQEVIRELIKGPKGRLLPTLPSQTELLSLQLDDKGIAKVNFSRALSKDHPGGSSAEMMTVYSVVNTLIINFLVIKRVQFLVEGKEIESITGHLSLSRPIASKPDLIKKAGKK